MAAAFKPAMRVQLLTRCEKCAENGVITPHPIALGADDTEHCPVCGEQVCQPGPGETIGAVVSGNSPGAIAARALYWAADKLTNLSRRLDK